MPKDSSHPITPSAGSGLRSRISRVVAAQGRFLQKLERHGVAIAASQSWAVLLLGCLAIPVAALLLAVPLFALGLFMALRLMVMAMARKSRRSDGKEERSVVSRIGDRDYRIASDDNYLRQVEGEFEPDLVALLSSLIRPDATVLDIGANIGCTSILFGGLAKRVISFEPSPSTFRFFQKNVLAAGLGNVTGVNSGMGEAAGSFELTFSKDNRSGGFVSNQTSASAGHQVERIDIVNGDAYLAGAAVGRVDFIKIDVEGFERDVIKGLAETLARDKPVVALELNHWCLNAFQRTSVPEFFDFLRGVFPLLYAVEGKDVRNLHDNNDAYHVMLHHITGGFQYQALVGAFDRGQLRRFEEQIANL